MQIRVVIPRSGEVTVETISLLEDLWHDYLFFRSQAATIEQPGVTADGRLVAKRYRRAALLMLAFYLEGVVNRWLKHLLKEADWLAWERKPLAGKVKRLEEAINVDASLGLGKLKSIRDALAHLKPGGDLELFDSITDDFLADAEASVALWLTKVEEVIGIARHPDTREESRPLREALGMSNPKSEGYSGV